MTLTEIAQYAGEKIGKTDVDTLTFLQKSASLNYHRVWNFAAWRETVTTSTGGGESHNHIFTDTSQTNLPPYYALAYIMRVT